MSSILYDESRRLFLLQTAGMSYACAISANGKLVHVYWGAKVPGTSCFDDLLPGLQSNTMAAGVNAGSRPYEFRTQEPFVYGDIALLPIFADGVRNARLVYERHEISEHKLLLVLRDEHYPLQVELHYELFGSLDLIRRRALVRNQGDSAVTLDVIRSATLHLPPCQDYRITHFAGNWGAELGRQQCMLTQAQFLLENHRGTCAAHQQQPFVALDPHGQSTQSSGEVFFAALCWSGNFKLCVERSYYGEASISAGINDFDCQIELAADETFKTPALALGFSAAGFDRMSEILYDWQFDWISPRPKAHAVRPIIYNSWYPYEFDVREDNILGLIDKAAHIGAELFVIDDGWMPKRVNAKAGLGDWVVDRERFPRGFSPITEACRQRGMLFGLWVEPEMVNPDSDLYRAHPDWVIADPTRPRSEQRHQLVLDLSRDEVRDWISAWLDELIDGYQLDYLKWDMNRYLSEFGSKRDLSVRYIQNLYVIWERLNQRHPQLLFENCASGGGRADFGMVPYADRINRSDNARPSDVMILHEGFSTLFLPKTAGGAGNISADVSTPLSFRIHLGMTGSMSVGINLLKADEQCIEQLRQATAAFKLCRADLQGAYVYHLASAREKPYAIWQYLRRDRRSFGLFAFAHGMRLWDRNLPRFRMRGLIPEAIYRAPDGSRHSGAELMNVGIAIALKGDYDSKFLFYKEG
jgi:alpha-galactosidase